MLNSGESATAATNSCAASARSATPHGSLGTIHGLDSNCGVDLNGELYLTELHPHREAMGVGDAEGVDWEWVEAGVGTGARKADHLILTRIA
jgi:hypothetical protein